MKILAGILVFALSLAVEAGEEAAENSVEPEATAILETAVKHFSGADRFRLVAEIAYDVVQDNGQALEFGAIRTMLVQKPGLARIEEARRDGTRSELVMDGERIWYHTPGERAYGTARQPGDIEVSLDFVALEMGIAQPLADLLTTDPLSHFTEGLNSAVVVGPSTIDGVDCTQLAYRNDVADFQVWLSNEANAGLKRLVISYRDAPGQPQFRATVIEFDADPDIGPESFRFSPPDGAEKLRFIVPASDSEE